MSEAEVRCAASNQDVEALPHFRLTGGVQVRRVSHWDRLPGDVPIVHSFGLGRQMPCLEMADIDAAWDETRRQVSNATLETVLPQLVRVVILQADVGSPPKGVVFISEGARRPAIRAALERGLLELFDNSPSQGDTSRRNERLIEAATCRQLKEASEIQDAIPGLLASWHQAGDQFRLGIGHSYLGEFDLAAKAFLRASRSGPCNRRAWELYCLSLRSSGDYVRFDWAIFKGTEPHEPR